MKKHLTYLLIIICISAVRAQTPAFPGAEGFGAYSKGGRGGDVYHVTTLEDDGAGSLRQGISTATGPRTIVFDLSGTISLKSNLRINKSNITLAGQTAPGDGICIRDYSVLIYNCQDIIIRYMRFRRGDVQVRLAGKPTGSVGLDVISIDDAKNIIIDHCSLSWSCDEIFGIVQNQNVTIQWCIMSEPLGDPILHPYGAEHAYGMNNSATTLSVHHNLIDNYVMRGPNFEVNDALPGQGYHVYKEAVNNVLFDYKDSGSRYTCGIELDPGGISGIDFRFHFINNKYICNPSNSKAQMIQATTKYGITDQLKVYVSGNLGPQRSSDAQDQWAAVLVEKAGQIRDAIPEVKAQMSDVPLFSVPVPVTTQRANDAYSLVLENAGCNRVRDDVDTRILSNVTKRKYNNYLLSQNEVGGWPELKSTAAPIDTDQDGMPDTWETTKGLNKNDPADRNGDKDGNGYTNLEDFINSFGMVTSVQSDKNQDLEYKIDVFPNPIKTNFQIRYSLPQKTKATLTIFNLAGGKVWTKTKEEQAGEHSLYLNSQHFPQGSYLLLLKTDQIKISKEFIITR